MKLHAKWDIFRYSSLIFEFVESKIEKERYLIMEAKGTAIKSILEFVKSKHADKLDDWLKLLPESSKVYMENPIFATEWYPVHEALIIPTRQLAFLYFNDLRKAAWQAGRFSADITLTGIYKVFIKITTPSYIIERASKIFQTFYRPSEINVIEKSNKGVRVRISQIPKKDSVIEFRIAGWIERALEINNCKNVKVNILKALSRGDSSTDIDITWD